MELLRRKYGTYTYKNYRKNYIRFRPTIVAKHLQACSGQRAQPAQAGGYPYVFQVFHSLANLPTDCGAINKTLTRRGKKSVKSTTTSRSVSRQSSVVSTPQSPLETKELPNIQGNATMEVNSAKPAVMAEPGTYKASLMEVPHIDKLTEKASAHPSQQQLDRLTKAGPSAALFSTGPTTSAGSPSDPQNQQPLTEGQSQESNNTASQPQDGQLQLTGMTVNSFGEKPATPTWTETMETGQAPMETPRAGQIDVVPPVSRASAVAASNEPWVPTQEWVSSWKSKLPLQTIMRLLQVLVPQVEKICIDRGLTDESEILRFLQHGTLVGLLPVPHPILIRKYQPNPGTAMWFRTYMWGVIYLRNTDPPIWYDTDVKLFEIQRV